MRIDASTQFPLKIPTNQIDRVASRLLISPDDVIGSRVLINFARRIPANGANDQAGQEAFVSTASTETGLGIAAGNYPQFNNTPADTYRPGGRVFAEGFQGDGLRAQGTTLPCSIALHFHQDWRNSVVSI